MEIKRAKGFEFAFLEMFHHDHAVLAFHNARPCAFDAAVVAREFGKLRRRRIGADRFAGRIEIQAAQFSSRQALNQSA